MEYELVATSNGPIIKYDGKHLTLSDSNDLLMVQEDNEGFIADMKVHIRQEIQNAHDEIQEAFQYGYPFSSTKIYQYVQAINLYQSFAFTTWSNYQQNVATAQGHNHL